MKIKKEPLKIVENYSIGEKDTLEIKSKDQTTEIFINGKKLKFVTKVKFTQEVGKRPIVKIERYLQPKDFEEIKKNYN